MSDQAFWQAAEAQRWPAGRAWDWHNALPWLGGSTFQEILPYFHEKKIGAYSWGAVAGKTQTLHGWETCQTPATTEPAVWVHDILRPHGTPHDAAETKLIQSLTKVQL